MKKTYGYTAATDEDNPIIRTFTTLKARNEWIAQDKEHRRPCTPRERLRRKRDAGHGKMSPSTLAYGKDVLPQISGGAKRTRHQSRMMM